VAGADFAPSRIVPPQSSPARRALFQVNDRNSCTSCHSLLVHMGSKARHEWPINFHSLLGCPNSFCNCSATSLSTGNSKNHPVLTSQQLPFSKASSSFCRLVTNSRIVSLSFAASATFSATQLFYSYCNYSLLQPATSPPSATFCNLLIPSFCNSFCNLVSLCAAGGGPLKLCNLLKFATFGSGDLHQYIFFYMPFLQLSATYQ